MTESSKTACFFAAALGAIGLAILSQPSTEEYNVDELRGSQLVEEFETDAPKRLRITNMNEETGDLNAFEVAELDGVWSIPSKSGYPADATEQMASAVEGVVGREVLGTIDAGSGEHATYGVVDPADTTTDADSGFGTRVKLTGDEDKVLADLIIGKQVKEAEGQYYVRKANQDVVYLVNIDVDKFSTDFANWIEKDLLGLSTFDVAQIKIDDYTVDTALMLTQSGLRRGITGEERRSKMHLIYDDEASKWQAESLEQYDASTNNYAAFTLGDDKELNEDSLREFKNALDDLVIVDVERKPEGLSADLKAGEDIMKRRDTLQDLSERGFLPVRESDSPTSDIVLLASEGEISVTLKTGVEYVMRFGDIQLDADAQAAAGQEAAEAASNQDDEGLNRYLFVMAQFNEDAIAKPELEELPELPADEPASTDSANEDASENEAGNDEAESEDDATDPEDEDSQDEAPQDEETAESEPEADSEEPATPSLEEVKAERERIEQNNKRAQETYDEQVAEGKKRVEELNARFGDWYYVIPNDVFKKVHLSRDDVVKDAEKPEGEQEEVSDAPAASLNTPGAPIPGLPDLGINADSDTDPTAEEGGEAVEAAEAEAQP